MSGDLPAQALQILNAYRTSNDRAALTPNANLAAAASSYARLMADTSWFVDYVRYVRDPHDGPDGSSPQSRIAASGYTGRFRGEALAGGQASARDAIDVWLRSPAHLAILVDAAAVEVGIGYYYRPGDLYGHYWVLVTGVP